MFISNKRRTYQAIFAFAAAHLLIIFVTWNPYYQLILTLVLVWAVMGLSWNVLSGYSGLVSFGHAAFFGLGAYVVALLFAKLGLSPWIGIPIGTVVGSLAGLLIGAITFRLKGHYFALAMLVYPLAMLYIFEWGGLQELSLPIRRENPIAYMQFPDQRYYSVFALLVLVVVMLVSVAIERSAFGLSLLSIKQNELAAEASGIDTYRWKLKAIAVSGAIAGGIGGFYAVVLLVVTPQAVFGLAASAQALIVTMFGGVGTVWGPVIGAIVLVPLAEVLHAELGDRLPGIQGVIFGLAIMAVIMKMPQGVAWAVRDLLSSRQPKGDLALHEPDPAAKSPSASATLPRSASDPAILKLRNVSRNFGGVKALADVTFDVRRGEILGVIGPNGAGKTTLFNAMNGIVPASSGEVTLEGTPLTGLRPSRICALGAGRTFQHVRPFVRMTLLENVVIGAFVRVSGRSEALQTARDVLIRVGLGEQMMMPAGKLTNYQLRLMELARALAGRPIVLLLDEPFAGLGAPEVETFMDLIRSLRAEGLTIVIIEHTMHAMMKLADRFVVLNHGSVIADGEPAVVTRDEVVISAYLGEKWKRNAVA
jgi:ABC-type branched-subunit amino acid transport system ATPase component/ABC-type branched-subunit amino acid transport system permease subunit